MFINRMLKVIESNNEKAFAIASAFIFNTLWKGERVLKGIRNESGGDAYI